MKKSIHTMLAIALIAVASSCGNKPKDSAAVAEDKNEAKFEKSDVEKDSEYAVKAAEAGMLEVQLGQLAQANGSSMQIKELGKMMITDHGKAGEELKAIAAAKNISLPSALGNDCQKKYDDLASKNGVEFDKAYSEAMIKDHKDAIDLFKKEADKGNDAELKQFAQGKISTLEHHLMMSEDAHKAAKEMK